MKELLFGWLLKPYYKITGLDEIIMLIEFGIIIFIGSIIYFTIQDLKEKRDRRNK
jgi:hypothetical protein